MQKTIILVILLSGCIAGLTGNQARDMTPEQIEAFAKQKMKVLGCFNFAGPPPAGGTTWLIVPESADVEISFAPNCLLLTGKINGRVTP